MLPLTTGSVETTLLLFVPSGIVAMRIEGTVTSSLNSPIVPVVVRLIPHPTVNSPLLSLGLLDVIATVVS